MTPAPAAHASRRSDCAFAAVVLALTALAASMWWLTDIVPGQDYPQFLVFVRAVRDLGDPASGFHGTYDTAAWYVPTSLPVHLTALLASAAGGSIEAAGKLMLSAQNLGLDGGLPNSSLAGYGFNYVRYVDGRNPMPGLYGPARDRPEITRFDYVLVRTGEAPVGDRFRLVERVEGWALYGVCGSAHLPGC